MRKVANPDLYLVVSNFLDCSNHDDDHADAATYGTGGGTDTIFALQKGSQLALSVISRQRSKWSLLGGIATVSEEGHIAISRL
jgi:hypothetical protein